VFGAAGGGAADGEESAGAQQAKDVFQRADVI